MRRPRFTTLQLLLGATFVALALGLITSAYRAGRPAKIQYVCLSPSGTHVAARYSGGQVRVWRIDRDRPRLVAAAFGDERYLQRELESIHFLDDQRLIKLESVTPPASANRVNVRELDLTTGRVAETARINLSFSQQLYSAASANDLYVADWGKNTIHGYDLRSGQLVRKFALGPDHVWRVMLSRDGKTLVAQDQSGTVYVLDPATGIVRHQTSDVPIEIQALGLSSDGSHVATPIRPHGPGPTQTVTLSKANANFATEDFATTLKGTVIWAGVSDNGQRLAVSDRTEAVEIWDIPSKELIRRITHDELRAPALSGLGYFQFSADGQTLVTSAHDRVLLWDVSTGKLRHMVGGDSRLAPAAIFITSFALWAAAWGFAGKRQRQQLAPGTTSNRNLVMPPRRDKPWPLAPFVVSLLWLCAALVLSGLLGIVILGAIDVAALVPLIIWVVAIVAIIVLMQVTRLLKVMRAAYQTRETGGGEALVLDSNSIHSLTPPLDLVVCWRLMLFGGLVALAIPIGFLFFAGPQSVITGYFSLLVGLAAIGHGAAGQTRGLGRTLQLQALNVVALDPLNLLLAGIEYLLLRRHDVQEYLDFANGCPRPHPDTAGQSFPVPPQPPQPSGESAPSA